MHKKWEFGPVLNTSLTSRRRNEQHKLPSGFWWLFIPSVCCRQTTKPSYLCPYSGSEVDLPAPIISAASMPDAVSFPTPEEHCHHLLPTSSPTPWAASLETQPGSKRGRASLAPTCSSLNWFSVLSHPSKIKTCKLLLLSLALWHLCIFSFVFSPFTLVLGIWHRTCQKGHKWEKAPDRRWMKTFKAIFFYRKVKFPAQDSFSFQIVLFS